MTNTSKTLLFFGNERLVSGLDKTDAPVLRRLIAEGYSIKAVISHHTHSRSRNQRPLEVAEIAAAHNIPVLTPNKPADILDQLVEFKADAALLVAYGRIIPQRVIDIFPQGIINIHPSLLPRYRGPTPIESAISNGDSETGVSIMQLTAGMDSGPVYGQQTLALSGTETKFDVFKELSIIGADLLIRLLPDILNGTLQPIPQDEDKATYCKLLQKSDSRLDLSNLDAAQAERLVRAHLGFPKSKVTIMGHEVVITKAHVSSQSKTPLDLVCQDGAFLSVDELVAPSGRRMSSDAFINGYLA